ncbi:MAG: 2-amino-4-hydroxy-6-hydroxymethyldihydropteridine diphosphokinase [Bacteroidota bacterium]|nr:2-amino-4-hydroxy-6-hydroxymethyldihydropteridine diphosphokinase [Bacteroidota bacterium]
MSDLLIGIGGNQGNRVDNLKKIRGRIDKQLGKILKESPLIESEPWGFDSDNWFLNQVVLLKCKLEPRAILKIIHEIEAEFGRERSPEYADRLVDIDVLFYGGIILNDSELQIPHPRLHKRLFVMKPLVELMPDLIHPVFHKSCRALLKECSDQSICRWYHGKAD